MNTFQLSPEIIYFLAWRCWRFGLKERRPNNIDFQNSQRARAQLSSYSLMAVIAILVMALCPSPVLAKNSQPEVQRLMSVEDTAKKALASLVTVVVTDSRGQLIKSGSGFFVDPHHIVTNLHVISGSSTVSVVTLDKKPFSVSSARIDDKHDLAVLDCPNIKWPHSLPLGNPDAVAIGESVVAAGSPYRMQGTISTGIVSAKRSLRGIDILQTTAPVSSGSSGGPLIDMRGRVIGINSFILANGQNLNFAQLSSHIPALLNGSAKVVNFRRGESVVGQSSTSDPNLDIVLMTLAKPDFAGSEIKRDLIGGADVVLIDQSRRSVYFSLPKSLFQEGNEKAQLDAIVSKFVIDTERIDLGVVEGMQTRFANYTLRRSLEKWVFFSTPLDNLRLRTDSPLRFKYKNAEYLVSSGELKSFQTNASVRGGRLAIDVAAYAKAVGKRLLPSFSVFVTVPGEPSLSRFVRDLTKGISDPEKKLQQLTDFVANEIQTDLGPNTVAVRKSSEVLMTRRGGRTSKTVLSCLSDRADRNRVRFCIFGTGSLDRGPTRWVSECEFSQLWFLGQAMDLDRSQHVGLHHRANGTSCATSAGQIDPCTVSPATRPRVRSQDWAST
jgi:hypothetical protein